MSREDPKPGRWLLPLVVAGLIGFTYVFVNALPEAEVVSGNPTTTAAATSTTTAAPGTTATTLTPAVAAFLDSTETLGSNVADLAALAQQINDDWDARAEDFGTTRDALEDLEAQTTTLADDTEELEVPPSLSEWDDVAAGLADLQAAAAAMIDGLVNAEGSEPRLQALADYRAAAEQVETALVAVREAVVDPAA